MWGPILQCCILAAAYVLPMHYGCRWRSRNHVITIRWRIFASLGVCSVAWLPLWLQLHTIKTDAGQLLLCLGLKFQGLLPALAVALGLTALVFMGPLAMEAIDWGSPQHVSQAATPSSPRGQRRSWAMNLRDLVVAPVTEEFVFRGCMAPLLLHRGFAVKSVVPVTPLFFGIAHLHHLYELLTFQKFELTRAIQQVAGQMLYTTVFGAYATWLLIRTGNLAAPIGAHILCNLIGFPDFDAMAEHRHQPLLSAATGAGVLLFCILCKTATAPALFGGPLAIPNTFLIL